MVWKRARLQLQTKYPEENQICYSLVAVFHQEWREDLASSSAPIKRAALLDTFDQLRQDTETTLPELPEQHRIREKEEELHGLESVHMAESEIKCTAPGLNTLEPECVTANCR
ncbi:hypothetical protein GJAV_G00088080 [Gymnothorax javanicus]|nr:hypothetical protein GJAV_G00088080 [Gymnothorax javanicus]